MSEAEHLQLPEDVREWLDTLSPESKRFFVETFSQMNHPAFKRLQRLLITPLPPDLEAVFREAHSGYINRLSGNPFEELRQAKGEDAARALSDTFPPMCRKELETAIITYNDFWH